MSLPGAAPDVIAALRPKLGAIDLSEETAARFSCGHNEFVIAINGDVQKPADLRHLKEKSTLLGVVARRTPRARAFHVYEYLLTHPEDHELVLFGVRTTGVITHFGRMQITDRTAGFEARALETPYSPAVSIAAVYDHGTHKLRLTEALVHPQVDRSRLPSKEPPVRQRPS